MKHIKKFNESLERGKTIFSGETKNGWKYSIISTDGSRDELQLATDDGMELDASEILHDSVDAYIDGDSSTKGFLVDVEDITEAYDKMKSLIDNASSLDISDVNESNKDKYFDIKYILELVRDKTITVDQGVERIIKL